MGAHGQVIRQAAAVPVAVTLVWVSLAHPEITVAVMEEEAVEAPMSAAMVGLQAVAEEPQARLLLVE